MFSPPWGNRPAAASDLLSYVELDGFCALDSKEDGGMLRRILDERGPEQFVLAHIELLERRLKEGLFIPAYHLARLHAHAGDRMKTLYYLERVADEHCGMALALGVNPVFKSVRDDPRFHAVLRRLKLEN
jgi:hypothetical protein